MSEQPRNEQQQGEEPPSNLNQVAPRLDTFAPLPESKEERERLEAELETLDAPEQQEGPTSEDAQP